MAHLGKQPHSAVIGVGEERLSLTASAVRGAQGEPLGFVAAWSLITQQERLEKESRALTQAVASSSTKSRGDRRDRGERRTLGRDDSFRRGSLRDVGATSRPAPREWRKIAKIIEVITDLSDQTNLLSLNATIEAARAGEMGRGFAIVASEVKNLARQTKSAIENIEETVNSISEVIESVATGSSDIRASVDRVSQGTTTIAASLEEQSITVKELSRLAEQVAHTQRAARTSLREDVHPESRFESSLWEDSGRFFCFMRRRWRSELLAWSRSRRIPRSRFGFPLICHAFELIGLGEA
ncbi:MAG: methyl-accepting chemotaxis protein [Pirellulaceae bacterium]